MDLKLARIEKNLTQQELADLVEATRQTIGLIEKGAYNPSLNLCIRIAKALDGQSLTDSHGAATGEALVSVLPRLDVVHGQ